MLLLRPVSFFENVYGQLEVIQQQGVMADSVAADLAAPMIAARDVAAVAAQALAARDWQGVVVRELLGQRDLTHREVTRILGERIGRPDLAVRPALVRRDGRVAGPGGHVGELRAPLRRDDPRLQ